MGGADEVAKGVLDEMKFDAEYIDAASSRVMDNPRAAELASRGETLFPHVRWL